MTETQRPQVKVIGATLQSMNGAEIAAQGGVADMVNEAGQKVGEVYVSRADDKSDGAPQYLYSVRYETKM